MTSNDSEERITQLYCKRWWCRREQPVRSEQRRRNTCFHNEDTVKSLNRLCVTIYRRRPETLQEAQ